MDNTFFLALGGFGCIAFIGLGIFSYYQQNGRAKANFLSAIIFFVLFVISYLNR
ncbi:hypothetical protein BpJC7_12650 [Weizmannia acidilactici]|uniref:Uncharacterized protein n=1 Tax=Weizmannia acidilactici TaxID=2607726 RepID=A0A5J4J4Q7_9BACI|nr:hypothetical protein [Weizmannia acidilactici]GER65854.1 hypothetical protein BpJC4_03250 [Weizmannia acidilactici]GER69962.1 hypothetical protein BpJC7_12650 [Weizmannia acidilactici]GER73105.1 hypothetical protein BpPP18_11720 [Weizmannia acidilactici]